jgi:glycosyltransferase involved in cell wall biosynthesis
MGRLVPPDNPTALAAAIEEVLESRSTINRAELHRYAVEHFGLDASRRRIGQLYAKVLEPVAARLT